MAFAYLQTTVDTANASTYTFASQNLGTAASNRYIIVGFTCRKGSGAYTVTSASIGGVSATLIRQDNHTSGAGSNIACLFGANVPSGTTGDIVITLDATAIRAAISVYSTTDISSITPYAHNGAAPGGSDPTVTLDIPAGGFALAVSHTGSGSGTCTWTGLTEEYDAPFESASTHTAASASVMSAETGRTITADWNITTNAVMAAASWEVGGASSVDGSGTPTEAADTGSGAATVVVAASGSPTEATDTTAGTATVVVSASGTVTEAADTATGEATSSDTVDATGAPTEAADTGSGTATVVVAASGEVTEAADTASGSAEAVGAVDASGSPTEAADGAAGTATVVIAAAGSVTEADDTGRGSANNGVADQSSGAFGEEWARLYPLRPKRKKRKDARGIPAEWKEPTPAVPAFKPPAPSALATVEALRDLAAVAAMRPPAGPIPAEWQDDEDDLELLLLA